VRLRGMTPRVCVCVAVDVCVCVAVDVCVCVAVESKEPVHRRCKFHIEVRLRRKRLMLIEMRAGAGFAGQASWGRMAR
jgi:hypothetical protein